MVAEVAEIKNDRWRNAIEGYLHTQKFYILVPHEYFRDALLVFNAIKRQKAVYGTGLVDSGRLLRLNPLANSGSLAEELETDDEDARLFFYFTLGRVQKCNRVHDIRRFRTAITDEGMLYQNFVVRAINPERFAKPAIGQGAILRRLATVKKEIKYITEQIAQCFDVKKGLDNTGSLVVLSQAEIEQIVTNAKNMVTIVGLQADLDSLSQNRAAIDTTRVDTLKVRIAALEDSIAKRDIHRKDFLAKRGRNDEKRRQLQEEIIPQLAQNLMEEESSIASRYQQDWVETIGLPRYQKELLQRDHASQIDNAFRREQSRAKNTKDNSRETLLELRWGYNERYKMGYDIKATDNEAYDQAWIELGNNQLPGYQTRISDAKEKAIERFHEDFISRLQNNIKNVRRQIRELNDALKGASFGEDTYSFQVAAKPDYKRYYDMIMDEMITHGGYNLLSVQFNDKYKEEIADLFAIITNDDGIGGSSEYERRVQEFTDYRTYLSFDLVVAGHDGTTQRLSKTISKKSGGETQTPFYIAVLASFSQLYRAGREKIPKTTRLIIFDEAFSKMDGERIIRSIELLRKFNFQVIISAPPDKISEIATLVDRNICVLRDGKRAYVRSFDPKLYEEIIDE
jgi:uncharacterized protein YPO0396